MSGLIRAYHRFPYPLRSVAASAQGARLRWRRYGADAEDLVADALAREHWSPDRWERYTSIRLRSVLERAHRTPAYAGQQPPEAGLAGRPILAKATLRLAPESFLSPHRASGLIEEHTSGTTATPLQLWISRTEYREWYALAEARWRRWYGISRHDRWGILGGQMVAPPDATRPPYWVWNRSLNQLYLSSYHISRRTAADYVDAIEGHGITSLLGYPSGLYALARAAREQGRRPRGVRVVIANAEPLLDHQRSIISEVFRCPAYETYGMAEYVVAASECEAGRLHRWPEVGILEVVEREADVAVPAGCVGRFVATSLLNATMPLLRYDLGDSGAVEPPDQWCDCGRTLPLLRSIEGRTDDMVRTADGRWVGRLDPVFKGALPIAGAQIVQEELDRFRVLVIPADGFGRDHAESIRARLRDRVGPVEVAVDVVDALPIGANGKVKAVVSHVTGS